VRPLLAAALLLFALAAALAAELSFPPLMGRVVDAAGLLTPQTRAQLEEKLASLEAKTSDQIVVATVPSLQGTTVEDFGNRLFREWKLGQAKTNNGVLLLVAPNERKMRIEVGYGLEGTLTDAISKVIISTAVTPRFKTGDYAGGIGAGVDALVTVLTGEGSEWQDRAKQRDAQPRSIEIDPDTLFTLFVFCLILWSVYRAFTRPAEGSRMHRTRSGTWISVPSSSGSWGGGWSSGGSSGFGGGFSGGGGSSGGGGASGDW
jgi:uncharacterized protein